MKKFLISVAVFSLFCAPVLAEVPVAEAYGAYQLLRHPGGDGFDSYVLHGFVGAVEGNVNPYFGVVGEFGYNRKSWEEFNECESFTSFLFGPRISYRAEKVRIFGHYLLGGMRYAQDFDGGSYTNTNFSQAVGGGVDVVVNDWISVRPAQLDLISIKWSEADGGWENLFRYSGGVVVKFGSKGDRAVSKKKPRKKPAKKKVLR